MQHYGVLNIDCAQLSVVVERGCELSVGIHLLAQGLQRGSRLHNGVRRQIEQYFELQTGLTYGNVGLEQFGLYVTHLYCRAQCVIFSCGSEQIAVAEDGGVEDRLIVILFDDP